MGTIRVSDEVKERLRDLKRDDESFNDLLNRLSRTEKDVEATAGFLGDIADDDFEQRVAEAHEGLNESLADRVGR